ncbi:venom allergen 3-like [Amblyomma americanum]
MGRCLHERLILLLVAATQKSPGVSAKRASERRADVVVGWLHPPPQFVVPCTIQQSGFDKDQQDAIVKAHNEYRSLVAKGMLENFQPAADMCEIIWDQDLAEVAQSYVEQCAPRTEAPQARDFIEQGQNLCVETLPTSANETGIEGCIANWFQEYTDCPEGIIQSFRNVTGLEEASCEHFTQLIWSRSQYVGCGFALVQSSDGVTRNLYACNYDEPGNHVGTAVYQLGDTCSSCPARTTCVDGLGLCRFDHLTTKKPARDPEPEGVPSGGRGNAAVLRTLLLRMPMHILVSVSPTLFIAR